MKPLINANVLITGGSKGIGFAIAKQFALHGHNLILVARRQEELNKAALEIRKQAKVQISTISIDLTESESALRLFRKINEVNLSVDILVNNAGVGMTGEFVQSDLAKMNDMLSLNMLALSELTLLFLQGMKDRNKGRILNVGSVVSYFAGAPNWAAYVASKHYVKAFTLGLAKELKGTGVAACVVSPGTTKTDFVEIAGASNMRAYKSPSSLSVENIAKLAYKSCQNGSASLIPGLFNKILAFLGELHPRFIAFEIFAFLSQKK